MYKYLLLAISLVAVNEALALDPLETLILQSAARSRTMFLEGVHWRNELLFKRILQHTKLTGRWDDVASGSFTLNYDRDKFITIRSTLTLKDALALIYGVRVAMRPNAKITTEHGSCIGIISGDDVCLQCEHKVPAELLQQAINDIG